MRGDIMYKQRKQTASYVLMLIIVVFFIYFLLDLTSLHVIEATEADAQTKGTKRDMGPFYWTVGIVGGCIAITLSYVSWRKYKGEAKKHTKKDPNS